ncbi:MAG: PLP-dependent aminotransferase family protein [Pseudomonadota bacterium]
MSTKIRLPETNVPGPRYRVLADTICNAVARGDIQPGEKLPPVRDLAWSLKISPGAVARAYKLGVERGTLEAVVGRGTFARAPDSAPVYALDALIAEAPAGNIDLRGNQAVDVGQDVEIGAALSRLISRFNGAPPLTGYRQREDDPEATEALAGWLRSKGIPAEADRLLVTSGAQAGVVAILSLLARGGGVVLTTPTAHPGLRDGAAAIGVRFEAVESDEEGLCPDALDRACARNRPDAIEITATLHNPTLAVMSESRRRALVAIARRHGVPIVEDDVYGQLLDDPPPTFAHLAPDLCWYVSSLSKCVAAGVRAGLVLTPPGRTVPTFRAYQALAHQTPWLVKALAAELVTGGEANQVRQRVSAETRDRAELCQDILGPYGAKTHPAASFAYLPLPDPWISAEFVAAAAAAGVLVPPASIYKTTRGGPEFTRVALGARVSRPHLREGLIRLAMLLRDGPQAAAPVT